MRRVGLFIPCFVNTIYPKVGVATLRLLEFFDYEVEYPTTQTCCGQPFYNSGFKNEAKELAKKFFNEFKEYDFIVAPSASCISMVKIHYKNLLPKEEFELLSKKSFEIVEFIHDIIKPKELPATFPYSIALHLSCHGLRELELASANELNIPYNNKVLNLLKLVKDIKIKELPFAQECCGFGGTFSVNESEVSIAMGKDKIANFKKSKADFLVGYDSSCLMHLASIKPNLPIKHVVQILASGL